MPKRNKKAKNKKSQQPKNPNMAMVPYSQGLGGARPIRAAVSRARGVPAVKVNGVPKALGTFRNSSANSGQFITSRHLTPAEVKRYGARDGIMVNFKAPIGATEVWDGSLGDYYFRLFQGEDATGTDLVVGDTYSIGLNPTTIFGSVSPLSTLASIYTNYQFVTGKLEYEGSYNSNSNNSLSITYFPDGGIANEEDGTAVPGDVFRAANYPSTLITPYWQPYAAMVLSTFFGTDSMFYTDTIASAVSNATERQTFQGAFTFNGGGTVTAGFQNFAGLLYLTGSLVLANLKSAASNLDELKLAKHARTAQRGLPYGIRKHSKALPAPSLSAPPFASILRSESATISGPSHAIIDDRQGRKVPMSILIVGEKKFERRLLHLQIESFAKVNNCAVEDVDVSIWHSPSVDIPPTLIERGGGGKAA